MEKALHEIKRKYDFNFDLKTEQLSIIQSIIDGKDTLGLLPTGFGKSLGFILPPLILDEMNPGKIHIVLIISSLKSLMMDQIENLVSRGLSAAAITKKSEMNEETINAIKLGKIQYVFASPEAAVVTEWFNVIRDSWSNKLCLICFDEAHCVSEWGESFRPEYRKVAMLRSVTEVPVLALTATVTAKVKKDIEQFLYINNDARIIATIPDRKNIHLQIFQSSSDYENELQWVLRSLKKEGINSPKTLIFCRSIPTVAEIFLFLNDELGESRFLNEKRLVEMFHASLTEEKKKEILQEFKKNNSGIRCIICTVAFGMGIDIPDVYRVIHWGAPKTILSYWQEVGRCARDGHEGVAICYAFGRSLNKIQTSEDVVKVIKGSSCVRRSVLSNFVIEGVTSVDDIHHERCCSACDINVCIN